MIVGSEAWFSPGLPFLLGVAPVGTVCSGSDIASSLKGASSPMAKECCVRQLGLALLNAAELGFTQQIGWNFQRALRPHQKNPSNTPTAKAPPTARHGESWT